MSANPIELYKNPPMKHQLAGLSKAKGKRGFYFACEQGTGKTFIEINEIAQLWGEGKINGVLVFAPNGVHTNWVEKEIPQHMPDWVRYRSKAWNAAAGVKAMRAFETILEGTDSTELRILAINWEALVHARSLKVIQQFVNSVTKLMIVGDEIQSIKNPTSKTTLNLEKIKMAALYRRALSGTPILNNPFDLFAQYRFLDPTILRTTSFFSFKSDYAQMMDPNHPMMRKIRENTGKTPQIVAKDANGKGIYRNLDRLSALVEQSTFRVLKRECLDLPDKVYTQSFFELLPAQRKEYRRMAVENRFDLFGKETAVASKLVALGKLMQISSGFLMTGPGTPLQHVIPEEDNPKLKLLRERLDESVNELGNQVIVWANFREEIAAITRLCHDAGFRFTTYFGDTSKEARTAAINAFQAGETQVFVVQLDTGATGITLTNASHVIYYSNTFKYGVRAQSEDRAHRIGQTKTVIYEDLIGSGTRDMKVVEALREKKDIADLVNGDAFIGPLDD